MDFSNQEMRRRFSGLREIMSRLDLDAVIIMGDTVLNGPFINFSQRYFTQNNLIESYQILFLQKEYEPLLISAGPLQYEANIVRSQISNCIVAPNQISKLIELLKDSCLCAGRVGCTLDMLPASWYKTLREQLPALQLIELNREIISLHFQKSEEEIEKAKVSASLADKAYARACSVIRAGRAEYEVTAEIEYEANRLGACKNFTLITSGSEETVFSSGIPKLYPASKRILEGGDTVLLEITPQFDGYDNDDPYCQSCCREIDSCAIHEYGYKPEAIFYGQGDRFFGVELEIDGGGEYTDNAESILSIANREQNLIYCKHDGSLDDGFEIVTHPMSLDFQLHKMPWQAVLQKAIAMGYLSHQAGTCGLHVHVSRDAFGDTGDAQDKAIARVLFFVERHWNELLRFSRRSQHQMDRWAARYGYRDHPDEMLEHIKKGYGNRYTCVNLTNENTVEFRMFRGTLKWNTLIATLQMVNRICDAAIYLPDEELRSMSWSSFVSGITEPELIQYLKERDLYINEPTEGEVEF